MEPVTVFIFTTFSIWQCSGVSLREQLEHIVERRRESRGLSSFLPSRRYYEFHPSKSSTILGAPSYVSHLPEAEPILPGHTLIRPALDMLKSSIKFPHKDMDNGAGVYGNIDNLGIRYDGRNEHVLYSGFRRMSDGTMANVKPFKDSGQTKLVLAFLRVNRANDRKKSRQKGVRTKDGIRLYTSIYPYKLKKRSRLAAKKFVHKRPLRKKMKKRVKERAPYVYVDFDKLTKVVRSSDTVGQSSNTDEIGVEHNDDKAPAEYDDAPENEPEAVELQAPEENADDEIDKKLTWFWNSKDLYNNIKISPQAPELKELVPEIAPENTKKWWFFHQADFEPFENLN